MPKLIPRLWARRRFLGGALVVTALLAGCAPAEADQAGHQCHPTIPAEPGFVPPAPYSAAPSMPGSVWYGSAELWTMLPTDGAYQPRKSVWWSRSFGGGDVEPTPDIRVTHERLDRSHLPATVVSPGTNAYTVPDGWFMIAGIDPQTPGCWKVTAQYRSATLSYVYEIPGGA